MSSDASMPLNSANNPGRLVRIAAHVRCPRCSLVDVGAVRAFASQNTIEKPER